MGKVIRFRRYPMRGQAAGSRWRLWRPVRLLRPLAVILALGAAAWFGTKDDDRPLNGSVTVVDGDTLAMGHERIRLTGIDAPELSQTCLDGDSSIPCGRLAREHLRALVGSATVRCEGSGTDRYGRTLARCRTTRGQLNEAMVRDGWAVSYGDYAVAEAAARIARRGLWRWQFVSPRDYRRDRELEPAGSPVPVLVQQGLDFLGRLARTAWRSMVDWL